jgi:uncharacterized delta-60 repeat protein
MKCLFKSLTAGLRVPRLAFKNLGRGGRSVLALGGILIAAAPHATAAAGDLDPSFGTVGKVRTPIDPVSGETLYSLAIQPDGKIVAAGFGPSSTGGVAVARYNSDGTLDSGFGTTGIVTVDLLAFSGAHAVSLQTDGKIVIAGQASDGTLTRFGLARFNSDGTLDTSFGPAGDGGSTLSVEPYAMYATSLVIQPDGRLIAAGMIEHGGEPAGPAKDFVLVRYTADGLNDTTFGSSGTSAVSTDFSTHDDIANAVALQADGKILAVGTAEATLSTSSQDFALARYNADGSLDASFGAGGKVVTDFEGGSDEGRGVVILADGKILVGGVMTRFSGSARAFALARYNPDGSLDLSFGSGGKVSTSFPAGPSAGHALVVQADGKILLAGTVVTSDYNTAWGLARYNADGSLDATFDTDGLVVTNFDTGVDIAHAIAIQADGKIVAGGMGYADEYYPGTPGAIGWDFTLARYLGDPEPPHTVDFYLHGRETPDTAGGYTMNQSAAQPSGDTLQLWKNIRWLSEPPLTGTFLPGATATVTLPRLAGRSATATLQLSATQLNGTGDVVLGQTTQVLGNSGANVVTVPLSGTPITLTNQRLKLSVVTSPGVNLKLEPNQPPTLEVTEFVGTP